MIFSFIFVFLGAVFGMNALVVWSYADADRTVSVGYLWFINTVLSAAFAGIGALSVIAQLVH